MPSKRQVNDCCLLRGYIYKALIMEAAHSSVTSLKWLGTTAQSRRHETLVSSISCQFPNVTDICTPSLSSVLHCFAFLPFTLYVRFVSSFRSTLLAASSGHRPFVSFRFRRRSAHPSIARRSQHLPGVAGQAVGLGGGCCYVGTHLFKRVQRPNLIIIVRKQYRSNFQHEVM
jgi:hypothetical protein